MSNYWRFVLCKENGSCSCFSKDNQPNEGKEDMDHHIVVSDIIRLVQDKQKMLAIQPGKAICATP